MRRLLSFTCDLLERVTTGIGAAFLIGMAGVMFFATVLRYLFDFPLPWSEEVLRYMMAWSILLLIGVVARRDEHIRFNFFAEKLFGQSRAPQVWAFLENLFGLVTMGFLSWVGFKYFWYAYTLGFRTPNTALPWKYPFWVVQIVFFIGMILTGLFYLERLVKQIQSWRAAGASTSPSGNTGGSNDTTQS